MPYSPPSWLTGTVLPWLHEQASVFGDGPLIVADVAHGADLEARRKELGGAIIIGVDETGSAPATSDVFDILLTTATSPPAPWVQVHTIANAVAELSAAIKTNPHAAVTLAQILRAQQCVAFEDALLIESLAFSTLLGGTEFRTWRAANPPQRKTLDSGPPITIERDGGATRIILAQPGNNNALTPDMRDHLIEALREAQLDDQVGQIEIGAQGRVFSQGGALDEFGTASDLALAHQIRMTRSVALTLHRLKTPVRVLIQGAAVGSGIEIAAAAQEVTASASAFFALPEVSMGLIPGAGGTVTIARRIGRQRTCYFALSGVRLRAPTALAWGLVDRIDDA